MGCPVICMTTFLAKVCSFTTFYFFLFFTKKWKGRTHFFWPYSSSNKTILHTFVRTKVWLSDSFEPLSYTLNPDMLLVLVKMWNWSQTKGLDLYVKFGSWTKKMTRSRKYVLLCCPSHQSPEVNLINRFLTTRNKWQSWNGYIFFLSQSTLVRLAPILVTDYKRFLETRKLSGTPRPSFWVI